MLTVQQLASAASTVSFHTASSEEMSRRGQADSAVDGLCSLAHLHSSIGNSDHLLTFCVHRSLADPC